MSTASWNESLRTRSFTLCFSRQSYPQNNNNREQVLPKLRWRKIISSAVLKMADNGLIRICALRAFKPPTPGATNSKSDVLWWFPHIIFREKRFQDNPFLYEGKPKEWLWTIDPNWESLWTIVVSSSP